MLSAPIWNSTLRVDKVHNHKIEEKSCSRTSLRKNVTAYMYYEQSLSYMSANQITWSKLLTQIHIPNDKQCRSRSVGFSRNQLIWIYTVFKGSAGPGLRPTIFLASFFFFYSIWNCDAIFDKNQKSFVYIRSNLHHTFHIHMQLLHHLTRAVGGQRARLLGTFYIVTFLSLSHII